MTNAGVHQKKEPVAPGSEGTPPYKRRYRWLMLALMWLSYFSFGIVGFSLPPLATPIIEDLNITYAQMGIIMGAWPLTYIIVAMIGGALMDRWGIRKSIFVGIFIISLSTALRYSAGGFTSLFLFVAMFGLGGPMISIGAPKTISLWFQGSERATAVGIYITGAWIGGAVSVSMMNSVIMPLTGYSWRNAFACLGLVAFVVTLLWGLLARDVKSTVTSESIGIDKVFRGLIGVRNVQLILVMGFLSFAVGHGFNDWLPKILESGGLSPAMAGLAASLPSWIGVPTVIIIPRLIPPYLRGRVIALLSLLVSISLLFTAMTSGILLIINLIVYGLSFCCILPLSMLILMDLPEVGSKYMGSASGMYFCIAELGGVIGPFAVGFIKDIAGGFLPGAYFLAGISLIRIVTALSLKIKRSPETR